VAEFDLAKLLKDVSKSDTAKQQIRYIPLDLIDPDPANFYSLDGLEELAGSIEMLGLQQPLLVRPVQGGRYVVISGHRRREALLKIAEGGSDQFADGVPCIVDAGDDSEALRELKLIMANADTRKMSSADQNKQAERIEDLLRQLVDEGYVFPGRLRDWVAKLSGMSRTKLARMKVIRENLDEGLMRDYYAKGLMNESVAYELAQRPAEIQRKICDAYLSNNKKLQYMPAFYIHQQEEIISYLEKLECPVNTGCHCINEHGILKSAANYKSCSGVSKCCASCHDYLSCQNRCPLLDEKAKAERAQLREAAKDERAAAKLQREAAVDSINNVWARFGQALQREGITDAQLRENLKTGQGAYNEYNTYVPKERAEALLGSHCTDTKPQDPMPYYYGFKVEDYRRLCTVADKLHVSLDYLFLRDDVPDRRNVSVSDTVTGWRTGNPPGDGRYFCSVKIGKGRYRELCCILRDGKWYSEFDHNLRIQGQVLGWAPLPMEYSKAIEAEKIYVPRTSL